MSYYNGSSYTFTWEGRKLVGAVKGSKTMSFTYNDDGIRTSKTVNGVTHTYYLNGTQIVAEEWGDKLLVYLYDASGAPIGMMYRTTNYAVDQWDVFWFEKNLQGDVVAVYNESGTKVATYTYGDAWGNHSVTYTNGGGSTGAQYNPFRYRGYYYDTDLGMYYLQSRYYDSNTCRFINADGYVSTGQGLIGNNMFAYCGNNPVNRVDPNGEGWLLVVAVLAIVALTFTGCSVNSEEKKQAEEKYNLDTININGNNSEGIINVQVHNNSIKIENSWEISNRHEKTAILNTIIHSTEYKGDYKDIRAMIIEWSGHNFMYHITCNPRINEWVSELLGKDDANISSKDVDINENDPYQGWYEFVTLGGLLSW